LIYRVPTAGGKATPVLSRDAQITPFAATNARVVFAMSDAATPREVYALAGDVKEPRRLTSLNQGVVENWKLAVPEEIRFSSFDGQQVHGWLYPPLAPAGPKRPLILVVHGGPHGMHGYGFNANFQAYASRGYGVLALNPRGSAGYGQRLSDGSINDWGGGDYRDLMAGVDYVLASHPQIDPQRLGITGTSYGGFMTNWAVTQTDRFRAGVAGASLSNLISFYATSLYQDLVHVEFNGFPWEGRNFETLWKWSPLAHIKNVKTPVLLLHGEQDNDVHITQAEEMHTALRYRGIDSVLVRYPREGHGLREPKHQVDALKRTLDWMDRYLKP
jgi:dipeptidyl aminopeptidase/acylaminoacyl peptidase